MEKKNNQKNQLIVWVLALVFGGILGCLGIEKLNTAFNLISTVFTRLFQFIAIPTIALAVITTLSELGAKKDTGKIFAHTIFYTLLTTFLAAFVSLVLYNIFTPGNIGTGLNTGNGAGFGPGAETIAGSPSSTSYLDYLISIIPNNVLTPLISGNVLSVILVAAAFGLGISFSAKNENINALIKTLYGLQEVLFTLIRALIWSLPLGILAFSAQLSAQIASGAEIHALGKYIFIVLFGNILQIFVIIPLFLALQGINPIQTFRKMLPALTVAFFTKSSAGTLPVTLTTAEKMGVNPKVSRFVLPICTTVNMNGCAAFILVTSLFVMQNAGFEITFGTMAVWLFISVFAAVGNAGVPMGCYFLTASLMSSIGAPLWLLGVILPVYAVIDMVETVENVWSDSAVCAVVDKDFKHS